MLRCSGKAWAVVMARQVLAALDRVAEQLQASGKAKTAAMQDFAIKCYTEILTPVQASSGARNSTTQRSPFAHDMQRGAYTAQSR